MKISIVTVVYNDKDEIGKTIESVLSQDYSNIEYIVIDGLSTDGTIEVIKRYSNKIDLFISERDYGTYNAMNKGINIATGDFIMFFNSGDRFNNEGVISSMVRNIDKDTDIIFGRSALRTAKGYKLDKVYSVKRLRNHPAFRHNAALYRLSLHKRHMFDESKIEEYGFGLDYNSIFDMYSEGAHFKSINDLIMSYNAIGVSHDYKKYLIYDFRISHKNGFNFFDWIIMRLRFLKHMMYNKHL